MKKYIKSLNNIQFTENSVPWFFLLSCALAFGLLIPNLGYFQDDWNFVFNYYSFGEKGLLEFLQYDGRPYAAWIFITGFSILGLKPLYWHIAELLLKWLTGYVLWLVFRSIWPNHNRQTFTASIIFLLYPFFTLQPSAVTYTLHWTGYLLFILSIYFMLRAQKKYFWPLTALALLSQALHLFTLEFYSGIDLLRPVLLWLVISKSKFPTSGRLKSTLHKWGPYLVVYILYFFWRGFLYQAAAEGRNTPLLLTALLNNPIPTILETVNNGISDIVLILISSWYKIVEPDNFDFTNSANRLLFLISLLSFGIFLFYQSRQHNPEEGNDRVNKQFFVTGMIALVLSLLPVYAADYVIHEKLAPWNSRFSLGSLLGSALIITSFVNYTVKVPKTKWIILSAVFGLLVGWHLQYTNDFRWAWAKQVNFYRQLSLRAPSIKSGTAILSEEEFLMYMGDYPTAYGINLIYTPQGYGFENSREADYWFFPLGEFYKRFDQYIDGRNFIAARAGTTFVGEPEGSIVISFAPEIGRCLWIIRPEYAASKSFSQTMRKLASISFVNRIQDTPQNPDSFLLKYLYTHPEKDWCYYYQKADLANQFEEWEETIQFWESATLNGKQPENGFEYLPFIEAFAHSGDWTTAKKMTQTSQKTMQGIDPLLCNIWDKLENSTPSSTIKEDAFASVIQDLGCDRE